MGELRFTQVNDLASKIEALVGYAKDILVSVSEYELNMIRTSIRAVGGAPPSTKLLLTEQIASLTAARSDLQYIVLKAKDRRREINIPLSAAYNEQFTKLTRQGRPSKQAIESEMYYMHPEIKDQLDKVSDIDNLLEFLESYFVLIDKTIATLEARRWDLG